MPETTREVLAVEPLIRNEVREEWKHCTHYGLNEEASIKACIACLAGGLWYKKTGVTSGAMQWPVVVIAVRTMFGADRIVGAEPQLRRRGR